MNVSSFSSARIGAAIHAYDGIRGFNPVGNLLCILTPRAVRHHNHLNPHQQHPERHVSTSAPQTSAPGVSYTAAGSPGGGAGGRPSEVLEVPVAICGGGPVGLTMSLLLAKYGIRHVVLERGLGPTQHPQAHFINNRTMEVFRAMGVSGPVRRQMPPLEEWRRFVYCESVGGRLYGEVDHFQGQSSPLSPHLSPEPVAHLAQHRLLPLMLARQAQAANEAAVATARAMKTPTPTPSPPPPLPSLIEVLHDVPAPPQLSAVSWGAALSGARFVSGSGSTSSGGVGHHDDDGARVEVEVEVELAVQPHAHAGDAGTPGGRRQQRHQRHQAPGGSRRAVVRCEYLVAADGAHSVVRGLMGGRLEGEGPLQHLLNAHFTSRALGALAASRPAMLYFVFNPAVVAVLVAHDIGAGEFVAQIPYFPPLQSPDDFPPERIIQLLRSAAGGAAGGREVDIELKELRPWTMTAQVANRYAFAPPHQPQHPRVFLVGDAAHRFPPAGGFGMNTGVQDASNLAWKLGAVLRGAAGRELLGSYESERRPVALANTALSVRNWGEATRIPAVLGLDPRVANTVSAVVANAAPLPQWARKGLLEAAFDVGRRLAGPDGLPLPLVGAWRQQQVQEILRSGASLQLQFPAEDLGFVYDNGAVVTRQPAGSTAASSSSRSAEARLPPRGAPYNPSSAPGCRLPHCWLQPVTGSGPGQEEEQQEQLEGQRGGRAGESSRVVVSSLDVVSDPWVGPRLLLFVDDRNLGRQADGSGGGGSNPWLQAAIQLLTSAASGEETMSPFVVVQVLTAAGGAAPAGKVEVEVEAPESAYVVHEPPEGSVLVPQGLATTVGEAAATALPLVCLQEVESGGWQRTMGLSPGSCLLVRPDGHVAWRHLGPPRMGGAADNAGAVEAAVSELQSVLSALHWRV